jgi:prepilin-type N-terminal cleavage/methylation domain-containing protein
LRFRAVGCVLMNRESGFSLFELIIVIIIIGITAMVAMPRLHSMVTEAKLDGAVGEVVSALGYARNLAVEHQRPFQVQAYTTNYSDDKANQFLVIDDLYESDPSAHTGVGDDPPVYTYGRVYNPFDKKPYIIDFDDLPAALVGVVTPKREYDGVVITDVPGGGTSGPIYFYPDGHCSDPAGAANTIVLSYVGNQKTITVDAITGQIEVQ